MTVLEVMVPTVPPRQKQIAVLIAQDKTNKQIADELGISQLTVEAHRSELYARLNVHSAVGLTLEAIRLGWVKVPGPGRPRRERDPE